MDRQHPFDRRSGRPVGEAGASWRKASVGRGGDEWCRSHAGTALSWYCCRDLGVAEGRADDGLTNLKTVMMGRFAFLSWGRVFRAGLSTGGWRLLLAQFCSCKRKRFDSLTAQRRGPSAE